MKKGMLSLLGVLMLWGCGPTATEQMNALAEDYVKIQLKLGEYDENYIDAYYGPEEWRPRKLKPNEKQYFHEPSYMAAVEELETRLHQIDTTGMDDMEQQRWKVMQKNIGAMKYRVRFFVGKKGTFESEALEVYDTQPPHFPQEHYDSLLNELDARLPKWDGSFTLGERYRKYMRQFTIPRERLDTVFRTAIAEARRRTKAHIKLPENEHFELEYVSGKNWSGYNWYKGNAFSLIQINTDFPIYIDRAIDLACHEGYPGHHVYNVLLEQHLARERGWVEYLIYPLYSPQSLIAEGSANYGIRVAFPGAERIRYEKEVLFPLAGIDTALADGYYDIQHIMQQLNYATNEGARYYFAGYFNLLDLISYLERHLLYNRDKAIQRARFINTYRSYVINYNWGQDLVAGWVARQGGTDDQPEKRWAVFQQLLSKPYLPSDLAGE
ncbi:MAG: hypothetical protein D6730_20515 [Bacteroidetes bacterium]|nr:MAG: hypothetical protein D6730_20515 [Bacteroidota bacterium]